MIVPEAPIIFDARNPELEAAILADPEAIEPWLIFGDWLQTQGDPRGVLIMRDAALRASPRDPNLIKMVKVRVDRYADYFRGPFSRANVELRWGFIHKLRMFSDGHARLEEILRAPRHPRWLNTIELMVDNLDRCIELVGELAPPTVRTIALIGKSRIGSLAPLAKPLVRMRRLSLEAGLTDSAFAELVRTPLPALRALGATLDVTQLGDLLARDDLPINELHVRAARVARGLVSVEFVDAIAESPLARQLEHLDLLFETGAELRFLEHGARFPRLRTVHTNASEALRERYEIVRGLDSSGLGPEP